MYNKLSEIVKYLNSSDPETIILGLTYLKEYDFVNPVEVFKIIDEYKKDNWRVDHDLDWLIDHIKTKTKIPQFQDYKLKGNYPF